MQLSPNLPAIKGDRVQLQQVLLNMVMNACHAMTDVAPKERFIVLGTSPFEADQVRIGIEDRGCGIPPADLQRIFEPFFTTKTEGLGMGLAICANIINAHAGKMWAKNNAEHGATFYFTLPFYSGGVA